MSDYPRMVEVRSSIRFDAERRNVLFEHQGTFDHLWMEMEETVATQEHRCSYQLSPEQAFTLGRFLIEFADGKLPSQRTGRGLS